MVDSESLIINRALDFFESKLASFAGKSTADAYGKALMSFRAFASAVQAAEECFTQRLLEDWYVSMRVKGLTAKTSAYYFDNIASLYNAAAKQAEAGPTDIFRAVKGKIKDFDCNDRAFLITDADYERFANMVNGRASSDFHTVIDTVAMALTDSSLTLRDIALMKKVDTDGLSYRGRVIARRNIEPKRKYVFALDQSRLTTRQAEAALAADIKTLFASYGLPLFGSVADTIRSYRAYAALMNGVAASDTLGTDWRYAPALPVLAVCTPHKVSAETAERVDRIVCESIFDDTEHWYAMRLRPRVSFGDVVRRFDDTDCQLRRPEMFYPCEEIAKKIGRKLVWREKPVISDVVFFKSRKAEIYPMFMLLYDLAWCYRSGRNRSGAYAVIPDNAMRQFQETIGKFTPDYEVVPTGHMALNHDDRVVVIGGDYAGLTGTFIENDKEDDGEGHTVYRIMLPGNNGSWNVGIDARLVRRADS